MISDRSFAAVNPPLKNGIGMPQGTDDVDVSR